MLIEERNPNREGKEGRAVESESKLQGATAPTCGQHHLTVAVCETTYPAGTGSVQAKVTISAAINQLLPGTEHGKFKLRLPNRLRHL